MTPETIVFYIFSGVLIAAGTLVITVRNSVQAALFLILAFVTAAVLWLSLGAEFLAIVLVLVYVGAVMVLFLFVIMMLDVDQARLREGFGRHLPLGVLVAAVIVGELVVVFGSGHLASQPVTDLLAQSGDASNVRAIGRVLYTSYVYPFELAAVILVIGIVAAIALTLRPRRQKRFVPIEEQVRVRSAGRVRMVDLRDAPVREEP